MCNDVADLGKKLRQRLLEANVAAVDAEVAKARISGCALVDVVAVVADLREPLARPVLATLAAERNIEADALLSRIDSGDAARIYVTAITRDAAIALFQRGHTQLSQALSRFPSPDRVWVVVVAAGSAALVSRSPR